MRWFEHPSLVGGAPVDVVLDTMAFRYEDLSLAVLRSSQAPGSYPGGTGAEGGGAYLNVLSSDWRLDPATGAEDAVS